ncbi:MAG: SpoIIE family protein phosphatase [Anaerovoracaceae bacterium]
MEGITGIKFLGKEKAEVKLWMVVALVFIGFLMSRTVLMGKFSPVGVAFIAILVSYHTLNLYLLPVIIIGMATLFMNGYAVWGDMCAALVAALAFLCAGRVNFTLWHKCVITGAISVIASSIYYVGSNIAYKTSAAELILEGAIVAVLCAMIQVVINLAEDENPGHSTGSAIVSTTAAVLLVVSGTGFLWLVLPAACLLVFLLGYTAGIMEGLVAGFVAGWTIFICGGDISAIILLSGGGLIAGYSKGQNRWVATICFAAVTLGFGLIDTTVNLQIPLYCPAAVVFVFGLMPKRWMAIIDGKVSKFLRTKDYYEKGKKSSVIKALDRHKTTFDQLASLYASAENDRTAMSYQFMGMSQIISKIMNQLLREKTENKNKYSVENGWAGYARNLTVSGDSSMWEDLEDGRFAMVISDGMGKGEKAAAESTLAVATMIKLLKAGLEPEMVLKLLNSILLLRSKDEIFATIDLAILDKNSGKVRFYKIGGATTFIKRGNGVETVKMSAMPMGIVDGLNINYVSVSLRGGDEIIMVSDGIIDSDREDMQMDWLKETISGIRSKDPQTMCDLVMNKAVENYGLREKDDLTVLTARIS